MRGKSNSEVYSGNNNADTNMNSKGYDDKVGMDWLKQITTRKSNTNSAKVLV